MSKLRITCITTFLLVTLILGCVSQAIASDSVVQSDIRGSITGTLTLVDPYVIYGTLTLDEYPTNPVLRYYNLVPANKLIDQQLRTLAGKKVIVKGTYNTSTHIFTVQSVLH